MIAMIDPTITRPSCKGEIKLTESFAAPLLESTRQQYEKRISDKEIVGLDMKMIGIPNHGKAQT